MWEGEGHGKREREREAGTYQLPARAHSKTVSANVAEIPQIALGGSGLFAVIWRQPLLPDSSS